VTPKNRFVGWTVILVAVVALLSVATFVGGGTETDGERIQRLNDSFACPQCRGESVAESNAAVSAVIRDLIAQQVAADASDEEIRDNLIESYGARVLLNPPAGGLASLLWVLPVVLVVGGAAAMAALVKRDGGDGPGLELSEADRDLVRQARVTATNGSNGSNDDS